MPSVLIETRGKSRSDAQRGSVGFLFWCNFAWRILDSHKRDVVLDTRSSCATTFRKAATTRTDSSIRKRKKEKNPILLIGSMGHFCELFDQLLRRLEPAVNRAAMNPDPFGKGFDRATLLQVNLNHLLPLCRQVESGGAWDTAGIDEI